MPNNEENTKTQEKATGQSKPAKLKWSDATQELPPEGQPVMVYYPNASVEISVAYWRESDNSWRVPGTDKLVDIKPTHWTALPEGPVK